MSGINSDNAEVKRIKILKLIEFIELLKGHKVEESSADNIIVLLGCSRQSKI